MSRHVASRPVSTSPTPSAHSTRYIETNYAAYMCVYVCMCVCTYIYIYIFIHMPVYVRRKDSLMHGTGACCYYRLRGVPTYYPPPSLFFPYLRGRESARARARASSGGRWVLEIQSRVSPLLRGLCRIYLAHLHYRSMHRYARYCCRVSFLLRVSLNRFLRHFRDIGPRSPKRERERELSL